MGQMYLLPHCTQCTAGVSFLEELQVEKMRKSNEKRL